MTDAPTDWKHEILSRKMLICVFTGFASGLPLYLLINLLPAWLRSEGIDLKAIGLFALIQLPFTWKFVWAPLMDRFTPPLFGRRRGWMLLTQCALLLSMMGFGLFSPQQDLMTIAALALGVSFFSASQDVVIDAFRREILSDRELGLGNTIHINAYRLSSLIPGSLALILADHLPWAQVFVITAVFMLPGIAMTLMVSEPALAAATPKTLREAVVEPFHEFIGRSGVKGALLILGFIFLYKLGDSMATALATPFYMDMGFSKSEIGLVAKHAGLWPAVIGGLLGGAWMIKLGINRALWVFGVVQVLSILGFAWLAMHGRFAEVGAAELSSLALVIGFEALGVGLGTAAFVAFIARTTHPAYTATQFALFTSLAAVPRTVANAGTGYLVDSLGWTMFFLICTVLALPGMALLHKVAPWKEA
ncbi:AmpG family muropeptide MFS transporter [Craterilacuibacter sinensis]|uniref:AmpG family muropeptide MFS transporter n=1 Tax=Craterilacuibacter sinensis TaxID=2686017 RepID=A0A845BNN1_9NEIS|nr:AmpG family muropeptide MFS transporter [Craterilacuibacter sinensis]MXR37965.1 AmpG family muropeptide MFS transporter [Craterilacuibacter sinensis]RQW25937.1 MFS transporter [Rhodobacteraceae bacterium CH30]